MSTLPPVKALQAAGGDSTTRVDSAHANLTASEARSQSEAHSTPASLGLLKAIAGHDAQSSAQQLRGQALELATHLRDKQRLLEQRESELNARTALLESDLRAARLRRFQDAAPRPSSPEPARVPALALSPDLAPAAVPAASPACASASPPLPPPVPATGTPSSNEWADNQTIRGAERSDRDDEPTGSERSAAEASPSARPSLVAATELNEQLEHVEQQRQQVRQREEKLERRQRHVEQMHDEVTQLHREALELRLASEQVWLDLTHEHPQEELSHALAAIRQRLADHYRLASDTLARRKDELHELRGDLNAQEQRLRQQRRDLQMWADRRYDEIESRLAKIILRERELDQMESNFQRQSIQWEQQRTAYRKEIEQLSWQLHERSAGLALRQA